jgi:hypothetical protein
MNSYARSKYLLPMNESLGRMIMLAAQWDSAPYLQISPGLSGRESLITLLEHFVN